MDEGGQEEDAVEEVTARDRLKHVTREVGVHCHRRETRDDRAEDVARVPVGEEHHQAAQCWRQTAAEADVEERWGEEEELKDEGEEDEDHPRSLEGETEETTDGDHHKEGQGHDEVREGAEAGASEGAHCVLVVRRQLAAVLALERGVDEVEGAVINWRVMQVLDVAILANALHQLYVCLHMLLPQLLHQCRVRLRLCSDRQTVNQATWTTAIVDFTF